MLDPVRRYTPLVCSHATPPLTRHHPLLTSTRPPPPYLLLKVTTPCGISYERSCLRDHLSRLQGRGEVGLDPISRRPNLTLTP